MTSEGGEISQENTGMRAWKLFVSQRFSVYMEVDIELPTGGQDKGEDRCPLFSVSQDDVTRGSR
jgi:hypothetical protein